MASEEENKQQGNGNGFAGLSSLVSDIDTTIASAQKSQQGEASSSSTQQPLHAGRQTLQEPKPDQRTYQPNAHPSDVSSFGKWLFRMAAIIVFAMAVFTGFIWLTNEMDNDSLSTPTSSLGPSLTTEPPTPAKPSTSADSKGRSRLSEEKPLVGSNNVLSTSEIRYCLAEKIRVDAAESLINSYNESDVDRFNKYVNDYNSRCGEFRYRHGALESARRDIEPHRIQLETEGRSRFDSELLTPSPDATVKAVQSRLNELGYNAGAADGLLGRKTRAAILAFQRDSGITADGVANASLLQQLELSRQAKRRKNSALAPMPLVLSTPLLPSTANQNTTELPEAERAAIERACDSARQYSGPSAYQSCLDRELASLQSSRGRPDLSFATSPERNAIEGACSSARQYSGPGAYYNCLSREISSLRASSGRPDLSVATSSEQNAIERACNSARQYSGPGDYYNCLNRELATLRSIGGRPDLSGTSGQEQAAIERTCDSARQYSGPGAYYRCLSREIASLRSSGGRPSFSNLDVSLQTLVERACDSSRQYSGPGSYYNCLRREINNIGYR